MASSGSRFQLRQLEVTFEFVDSRMLKKLGKFTRRLQPALLLIGAVNFGFLLGTLIKDRFVVL